MLGCFLKLSCTIADDISHQRASNPLDVGGLMRIHGVQKSGYIHHPSVSFFCVDAEQSMLGTGETVLVKWWSCINAFVLRIVNVE